MINLSKKIDMDKVLSTIQQLKKFNLTEKQLKFLNKNFSYVRKNSKISKTEMKGIDNIFTKISNSDQVVVYGAGKIVEKNQDD